MVKFWVAALKISGPVTIVAFVLWFTVQQFFQVEIINLFDSEQRFLIVIIALGGVLICLLAAVLVHKEKQKPSEPNTPDDYSKTANITGTKISGDFVMGDKNETNK